MTTTADLPRLVTFSGPLTLATAEAAKATLLADLDAGAIRVDCSAVDEADVTAVQLLLAAHRSAQQRNRGFALAAPLSPVLADAFERCGLPDFTFENTGESR